MKTTLLTNPVAFRVSVDIGCIVFATTYGFELCLSDHAASAVTILPIHTYILWVYQNAIPSLRCIKVSRKDKEAFLERDVGIWAVGGRKHFVLGYLYIFKLLYLYQSLGTVTVLGYSIS